MPHVWDFIGEQDLFNKLCPLILSGQKTATAGLLLKGIKIPKVGEVCTIIDPNNLPICKIIYTKVEIKKFNEVTFDFAKAEGEGFKTLKEWQDDHIFYFKKWHPDTFTTDSLVACEHFKLLDS